MQLVWSGVGYQWLPSEPRRSFLGTCCIARFKQSQASHQGFIRVTPLSKGWIKTAQFSRDREVAFQMESWLVAS